MQCTGTTRAGQQCKRTVVDGEKCYSHQKTVTKPRKKIGAVYSFVVEPPASLDLPGFNIKWSFEKDGTIKLSTPVYRTTIPQGAETFPPEVKRELNKILFRSKAKMEKLEKLIF